MKAVHGYLAVAILASSPLQSLAQETLHASKLLGARVQNAQGEDLGEVEDLLVGADETRSRRP